jgi:predicted regulator of Ras-like GTPase activity (Roadblock/LC7/MglB family)
MPNAVYDIVCDALSRIVSHRAAENIVTDALRGAKLSALDVRPEQMQALLKSEVFRRLQQIIPVAQAKGEIRQILTALESGFAAARAFSPEVEEGWLALRDEFRRVNDQSSPRAQRLAKGIEQLPDHADPVRVLNDLWAELDLLQLELSPNPLVVSTEPRFQGDLLLESGEFASLNFELDHFEGLAPEVPSLPLGRPGAVVTPRIHQDLNLTIVDEPLPQLPVVKDSSPQLVIDLLPQVQELPIAPLEFDLDSLIAPAAPVVVAPVVAAPVAPLVQESVGLRLQTPEDHDALLTRFALEEGVTGVLLSKRNGDVIASRLSAGSASHLAGVVAATTMLLAKRRHFRVFYTHLESVSAFVAPLGDQLLTVLADAKVNVGRVFTELESLKETA